jgi:hypothetical protein
MNQQSCTVFALPRKGKMLGTLEWFRERGGSMCGVFDERQFTSSDYFMRTTNANQITAWQK